MSVNHFNFCDLAGSERLKKTRNEGNRLKESTKINKGLSVLRRCIEGICVSQKQGVYRHVPFRESKITKLLEKPLTGRENIFLVVNINHSPEMFDESLHTLHFSGMAKEGYIEQPKPKPARKHRFSEYLINKNNSPTVSEELDMKIVNYKGILEDAELECRALEAEKQELIVQVQQLGRLKPKVIDLEQKVADLTEEVAELTQQLGLKSDMVSDLEQRLKAATGKF